MAEYTPVASVSVFKDGLVRNFEVEGVTVAVVRHEGRFYAFQGQCPHSGYPFDWTRVRPGELIACSSHFSYFELATGRVLNGPATDDLAQYSVRVEGDEVLVSLEPVAEKETYLSPFSAPC